MEEFPVHEIIIGAINAIERYGWIQNTGGDTEVGFCTIGGFGHALRENNRLSALSLRPPTEAFIKVIGEGPIDFNDAEGRTKEEVLDALRKVAAVYVPEPDTEFLNEDSSRSVDRGSDSRETALARA